MHKNRKSNSSIWRRSFAAASSMSIVIDIGLRDMLSIELSLLSESCEVSVDEDNERTGIAASAAVCAWSPL